MFTAQQIAQIFYPNDSPPPDWVVMAIEFAMNVRIKKTDALSDFNKLIKCSGITKWRSHKSEIMIYKHSIRYIMYRYLHYDKLTIAKVEGCDHSVIYHSINIVTNNPLYEPTIQYLKQQFIDN